ncbi:MAG TPA: trypsin-like peptidase domain-containing protein [Vitreimonas sp.]|nr:trypsin-like peptidase domain-containing protein [Vitreimonas sp.]
MQPQVKTFLLGLSISVLVLTSFFIGALADRIFVIKPLDYLTGRRSVGSLAAKLESSAGQQLPSLNSQTSTVADVSEAASPSVVTVSIKKSQRVVDPFLNSIFGFGLPQSGRIEEVKRDIGTGFVADESGLIVTNKHVVDDPNAEYSVVDKDNNEYRITNIYRDPANDLAIVKVEGAQLEPLPLGDSDKLRVGQEVIAIGTALGTFRHTVTTGVVSGLGRGIEAGTISGGTFESLEGVIQTDAAINPGNSGGPLLDANGAVIGVNVAVTAGAQNIGFALPINVVKTSLSNFNQTGQFDRPFLGVQYRVITKQAALLNEVPEGAYLLEVVAGSPAAEAGMQTGDIVTEFDGQALKDENNQLATLINNKKIGDTVTVKYWRDGEEQSVRVELKKRGE